MIMSTLKANFIFLSLTAIIALSLVLTSCEQEELLPIDPSITEKTPTTEALEATPNDDQLYIVTFNTGKSDKTAELTELKGKSREDAQKITEKMNQDFRTEIKAITKQLDLAEERISSYYTFIDAVAITLTPKQAEALKTTPLVSTVEADRYVDVTFPEVEELTGEAPTQTDTKSDYIGWFNSNHGGYKLGGASKATWIWIVDTGIDLDHPDLNVQTSTTYAKSFVGGTANDCNGHGTHVAGIAAARKNNTGIVGMSEGARVVPVRIMSCTGGFPMSRLVDALNHVITYSISGDVVNMSIGGSGGLSSALTTALNTLNNKGVYCAIAAGNDNALASGYWPASYNNTKIKTVASMDYNSVFSSFSNYNLVNTTPVDYIATGRSVYSTYRYGGYATLSGTSMATPVVAGIMHARGTLPRTSGSVTRPSSFFLFPNTTYPKARL